MLPDDSDCCLHETLSCNEGFELTHFYVLVWHTSRIYLNILINVSYYFLPESKPNFTNGLGNINQLPKR